MLTIISGGQTGADRTALEIARELGLPTGGTAPKGWRTDAGPDPSLAEFGLVESWSPGYRIRTIQNVRAAEGTVIFGRLDSPGCALTIRTCDLYTRPCLTNPMAANLAAWLQEYGIRTLNVAGNRLRTNPGIVDHVRSVLKPALEAYLQLP